MKFEASNFTIKLCSLKIVDINYRKRDDSNIHVHNTIFSKYLALPVATFPLLPKKQIIVYGSGRPRSDKIFYDKKAPYQLGY